MNFYVLTPEAAKDLDEIHDYIAVDNPSAALHLIDALEEKCRVISQSPEMGRKREELAPSLRSFSVGNSVHLKYLQDPL